MRKPVIAGLVLALTGFLFTGCMKMNESIVIKDDGSFTASTEINIRKERMLEAYTKILNEEGGEGFTTEQVAVLLGQSGIKLVKIDGSEYYKITPSSAGQPENKTFSNITDYYKQIAGRLYQAENDTFSISETSVVLRVPENSNLLEKAISEELKSFISVAEGYMSASKYRNGLRGDSVVPWKGETDGGDKVVPWEDEDAVWEDTEDESIVDVGEDEEEKLKDFLNRNKELKDSLKEATVTYKVTFPAKIKETSAEATVSKDKMSVEFTVPVLTDRVYYEYAYCENDIAATGALNGVTYNKAVNVAIPVNVTAFLNGRAVSGSVTCDKTGTYNFSMSDIAGTTETLCFMVDTQAPMIYKQKDTNMLEFTNLYEGEQAFVNDGYLAVYDVEGGVRSIRLDGNDEKDYAIVNSADVTDSHSLVRSYDIYSIYTGDLDEGIHVINVVDYMDNETEAEFIIDKTAPSVSGVKNGKTYKKAVTIKFSDKNGVQAAKLNGSVIKSGTKTSKKGNYTLKVTDNAGNTKTVNFKIS